MSAKPVTNLPASIHQRLLNRARETNRPLNELLQYFAMERFLYRLSMSDYADRFILKGGLLLRIWDAPRERSTKDIDFLGMTENSIRSITVLMREICLVAVEPDGLIFDPDSIAGEVIKEDADYEGVRVHIRGSLATAKVTLQIDIGFGDIIIPESASTDFSAILDFPAPRLNIYSRESVIAEKFETMVKRDWVNSRMKDFYDIWWLSRWFDFDGPVLVEAVRTTFMKRHTAVPPIVYTLTPAFGNDPDKVIQWKAFVSKNSFT